MGIDCQWFRGWGAFGGWWLVGQGSGVVRGEVWLGVAGGWV